RIATEVFASLGRVLPWVCDIERAASDVRVEGGWVYSQGGGSLDDPVAAVHRRNRLGITRLGSYFSVDTGKYSVAPTLAERLARAVGDVWRGAVAHVIIARCFVTTSWRRTGGTGSPEVPASRRCGKWIAFASASTR